ncbi:glycoside hydrolase family 76 protein [Plenodomus tracheiphilus IPT5]|uniref:Mannan endo-1,6-alpha-mannosidase n=1 Tax=Plenodomus tracheiphilus IPT5 TaxID=1408161 RepID=A0A6A7AVK7_9PLEO|nr:glycoside hydrolase family 76 protein [Plenodomus tracheiphilus IPT5]
MWCSIVAVAVVGLLSPIVTSAIELNVDDPASIKNATRIVAAGLRGWYTGDRPGDVPGNLPDPYYWWLCGAMFNSFIDYWYYTGDDTYNAITTQALVHQIGSPQAFMPPNQTSTLGNDDQAFWGMAAMSAAENKLPDAEGTLSWLSLAIAVFNTQVPRWNPMTCGGGLNWQIFNFNRGYDYKNTISNGGFFNIAARLAKYTQNSTYIEWAEKVWDWELSVGLISQDYHFYDGTSERLNCTEINHVQWTYNAGIHMAGAAALWNTSESLGNLSQAALWRGRLVGIIKATDVFFSQDGAPNVMIEVACERNGLCDYQDQRSFKAYLSRWMGYTMLTAPWTQETIIPKLRASAIAAAKQCGSGKSGCGLRWWQNGVNDGEAGVGEQMAALEVMQNLLVGEVAGPASEKTGGISKNDPSAGTESVGSVADRNTITTGDRVSAAFLTAIAILATFSGVWWLIKDD